MKPLVDLAALCLGIIPALVLEQVLPPMEGLHHARIILVPMVFTYAAMVLPFPSMIAASIYTGLLNDLMHTRIAGEGIEIPLGFSIVFFTMLGTVANSLHSPTREARNVGWFVLLAGLGTSLLLFLQFCLITLHRGGIHWEEAVTWRILAPGIMASLLAPLFHWSVSHIDRWIPDGSREAGPVQR
jgi:hypothetical protein